MTRKPSKRTNTLPKEDMITSYIKNLLQVLQIKGLQFQCTDEYIQAEIKKNGEICEGDIRDESTAMKYIKTRLALVPHFYFNSEGEAPEQEGTIRPDKKITSMQKALNILGGAPNKFIKDFFHGRINGRVKSPEEKASLIESIRVVKDGIILPSKEAVDQGVRETFKTLTSKGEDVSTKYYDVGFTDKRFSKFRDVPEERNKRVQNAKFTKLFTSRISKEAAQIRIKMIVREIFKNNKFTLERFLAARVPSQNANYVASRSERGAFGHIQSDLLQEANKEDIDPERKGFIDYLKGLEWGDFIQTEGETQTINSLNLEALEANISVNIFNRAYDEKKNIVELVGLAEPLKIRTISKESPWITTWGKSVQKWMWSVLYTATNGVCDFIGRPVEEEDIGKLEINQLTELLSLDYSQATNLLHSWATDTTVDALIEFAGLPEDWNDIMRLSLTQHDIEYKELRGTQQRGQLMGSITSFPILCIINLVVCHWALEISHNKVIELKDLGKYLRINGDDGLIAGKQGVYNIWKDTSSVVGFKPSPGKVLVTNTERGIPVDKFACQINNTTFLIKDDGNGVYTAKRVKKINSGILNGRTEIGRVKEEKYVDNIFNLRSGVGAAATELMRDCWDSEKAPVLDLYIEKMVKPYYSKFHIPWYIPSKFGGMGLPAIDEQHCPSIKDLECLRQALVEKKLKGVGKVFTEENIEMNALLDQHLIKNEPQLIEKSELGEKELMYYQELEELQSKRYAGLYGLAYWITIGHSLAIGNKIEFPLSVDIRKKQMRSIQRLYTPSTHNQTTYIKNKYGVDYESKMKYLSHLNDYINVRPEFNLRLSAGKGKNIPAVKELLKKGVESFNIYATELVNSSVQIQLKGHLQKEIMLRE